MAAEWWALRLILGVYSPLPIASLMVQLIGHYVHITIEPAPTTTVLSFAMRILNR